MTHFKPALGHLCLNEKVDLLPMYLGGTHDAMPVGALAPKSRKLSVKIGAPITAERMLAETKGMAKSAAYRHVARAVEQAVRQMGGLSLEAGRGRHHRSRHRRRGRHRQLAPGQRQRAGGRAKDNFERPQVRRKAGALRFVMLLFVTGGTGFLGRAVIDALLAAGHQVRAMVRDPRHKLPSAVDAVEVGFEDGGRLRELLSGVDAIVHLAGKVSRDPKDSAAMHHLHVECTQKLLDAAEAAQVKRIVLASTSGTIAVNAEPRRLATEDDEPPFELIGKWPYYTSKRLQEQEVLRRDKKGTIEGVVLNPSLLLGPGDERLSSTADVLNILNRRVPAITDGTVALVDVRDVAPMFVKALTAKRGERYLLNGANMSVRSFVERVALAGGVGVPKLKLKTSWAVAGAKFMESVGRGPGSGAADRRSQRRHGRIPLGLQQQKGRAGAGLRGPGSPSDHHRHRSLPGREAPL
jgi:dihydroflavonol-4-reductase